MLKVSFHGLSWVGACWMGSAANRPPNSSDVTSRWLERIRGLRDGMIAGRIAVQGCGHKPRSTGWLRHAPGRRDFVLAPLGVPHSFQPSQRGPCPRGEAGRHLTAANAGGIAQLVERLNGIQKVRSSNLL